MIIIINIYFILHTKQGILNTYRKTHFLNKQFSDLQLLSILLLRRLKKTMHQLIVFFTSCHVFFYSYLTLNSCTFESELNPPLRSELVLPRPVHQLHWQGSLQLALLYRQGQLVQWCLTRSDFRLLLVKLTIIKAAILIY